MANNQSSYNSQANLGSFIPSTYLWEVQQLQEMKIDPNLKELLIRLYQNLNSMAIILNTKDTGYYSETEIINGQVYFPTPGLSSMSNTQPEQRQVFRTVVNFGPLPASTTKTVPHDIDIDSGYSFTRIYGAATNSDQTSFIPLPFSSPTLNQNIRLEITDTNISITTAIDYSAYINVYIVLEYMKQN